MYGQKQILQCLAVALLLAVFNFHRSALKRTKSIPKPKLRRPPSSPETLSKIREVDISNISHNSTGYCMRIPFGHNLYVNHDADIRCNHICFDTFETWLREQCEANCCVRKNATLHIQTMKSVQKQSKNLLCQQKTRNCKNTLVKYIENGAGLHINRCESVKTIIEPINENLISRNHNQPTNEYECKIQTLDELICKNTTSVNVHQTKLETNKTQSVMEYQDFLFDIGTTKPQTKLLFDIGSIMSGLFAVISFFVILITIRYMFKLFMTDHAETFFQVMELRQALQLRLEQINEQMIEQERTANMTAENENPGHHHNENDNSKSMKNDSNAEQNVESGSNAMENQSSREKQE